MGNFLLSTEIIQEYVIFGFYQMSTLHLTFFIMSIFIFLDIGKSADFWWKNADVSRTQGLCHVINTLFGSSLGKV